MTLSRRVFTLLALAAASACGDAGSGEQVSFLEEGATVTGEVGGEELTPVTWMAGTSPAYSFNQHGWSSDHTVVKFVDTERGCGQSDFENPPTVAANSLLLDLFEDPTQPDSRVTEPGTFEVSSIEGPISSSRRAIATFVHDAVAGTSFLMTAESGTVTVSSASAEGISGTFDLVFNTDAFAVGSSNEDRLTGTFGALFCETPFPPVRINTPGQTPETGSLEINVQLVGAAPAEVVLEADGPWLTTASFSETDDGIWQLGTPMPTGDYDAIVTASDEQGEPLCEFSLELSIVEGKPTKIDTVVTCQSGSQ